MKIIFNMKELRLWIILHVVLLRCFHVSGTNGGLVVRVSVPQYRIPGEIAQLRCDYNLGNDSLYAVKWYKDHEEFYRFVPKQRPETISYSVEGVDVDMSLSNNNTVVLRSISLKTSGLFRCEVSAEAPSFSSAQSEARMDVVSLPKEDPQITGVETEYQIGEEVNLNCTSGRSHPASILHWYINEQQIVSPTALIHYPPVQHKHGLVSSILGLRFILTARHFMGGSMKIKCVATLSPVLWRGDRESIVQSLPVKQMREALLLVRSDSSGNQPYYASTFFAIIISMFFT
ncbi:junctional adhesion molecule 2A-like [Onthophagus taurus]|uniref:junctional adhesion molecule 2A-like n=1 Tax=Onthophagus taurus TaxID=166361 RepID=UPI000C208040|nr:uncharacterized protein LOC111419997 [Onthophagus taurus]